MLDTTVNLDGVFSYIIYSESYIHEQTDEVKYRLRTKTHGNDSCRSVAGCFESKYIEPNIQKVLDAINAFEYGDLNDEQD